jgi:hypothetical protein
MGTWTSGVPYTDPTPDQVTNEVNEDRDEAADEAAGLPIDDLPTHTAVLALGDTMVFPANVNGVTSQLDWREVAAPFFGSGNIRAVADTYTAVEQDTSLVCDKATGFNVSVPHLTSGLAQSPLWILQAGAGQVTVVAGALALVLTTGTGRTKTRAQWSRIRAEFLFDFSGSSVWTVTGDVATS